MEQWYRVLRTLVLVVAGLALVAVGFPFLGLAQEATIAQAPPEVDPVAAVLGFLLAASEILALLPIPQSGLLHAIVLALRGLKGRSALPVALLCLLAFGLTACKTGDGAKFSQRMLKIQGDVHMVLVEGCDARPGVLVITDSLRDLLPPGSDVAKGLDVGDALAARICERVREQ